MTIYSKLALCPMAAALFGCTAYSRIQESAPKRQSPWPAFVKSEVYKSVGSTHLTLDIYEYPKSGGNSVRPAIVFFFGGGWSTGSRDQFELQARYFASRGMVAITADYRIRSRHQSKVINSVADARSAIRWVRANADRLRIDPKRIAASGGSAGGHLAASTAFIREFDDAGEDPKIPAEPNALILFNPALVLAELPGGQFEDLRGVPNRAFLGAEAARLSPAHQIKSGGPPTLIFHGLSDKTVPYVTAQSFSDLMKSKGNRCTLVGFPDQGHGFFNRDPWLSQTLRATDEFLHSLGWIEGPPALSTQL